MIALLERREQLYHLIGTTGITIALAALLFIHLPGDVQINYMAWYALIPISLILSMMLLISPRWLTSRRHSFWIITLVLYPLLESVAVFYSGGVRSPFFVIFYFSLFFTGMVGGHKGALIGSVISSAFYVLACLVHPEIAPSSVLLLRFSARVASFYGLALFAAFLGKMVERQAEESNQRALRIVALNDVTASLGGTLDLEELFDQIPRELCHRLGFQRSLLFMLEDNQLRLAGAYAYERPERLRALRRYLSVHPIGLGGPGLLPELVARGNAVICNDPESDPRINCSIHNILCSESFAAVPLVSKTETIGVLVADYYPMRRRVRDEELELLRAFASLAALAVSNCRLALRATRAEAFRQLDSLKTEFLTDISHELRTPLTLIRTSSELLLDDASEGMDCMQQRLLRTVYRNSERLTAFMQEILEMSRLEEGRIVLRKQPTDLRVLVQDVVESFHVLATGKEQWLCLDFPSTPCTVEIDRHRMQQVITNLVVNAHKYIPEHGHIWIELRTGGEAVTLEVRDNGPGIPPDQIERIFEKFYRAGQSDNEMRGAGLGLAIVKSLIELHGGEITARSALGEGTEFRITLPVSSADTSYNLHPKPEVVDMAR